MMSLVMDSVTWVLIDTVCMNINCVFEIAHFQKGTAFQGVKKNEAFLSCHYLRQHFHIMQLMLLKRVTLYCTCITVNKAKIAKQPKNRFKRSKMLKTSFDDSTYELLLQQNQPLTVL